MRGDELPGRLPAALWLAPVGYMVAARRLAARHPLVTMLSQALRLRLPGIGRNTARFAAGALFKNP